MSNTKGIPSSASRSLVDANFPIYHMDREYHECDCNLCFLLYYEGRHCLNEDSSINIDRGKKIYPDGIEQDIVQELEISGDRTDSQDSRVTMTITERIEAFNTYKSEISSFPDFQKFIIVPFTHLFKIGETHFNSFRQAESFTVTPRIEIEFNCDRIYPGRAYEDDFNFSEYKLADFCKGLIVVEEKEYYLKIFGTLQHIPIDYEDDDICYIERLSRT